MVGNEQDNGIVGDAKIVELVEHQPEAVVHPEIARLVCRQPGGRNPLHDAVAIHQAYRFLENPFVGDQRLTERSMPLTVGTMQQGGAVVEIERTVLVLLDKLQRGGGRPFRVMPFEGRIHVTPIDIFRPGESLLLDHLAMDLFVFKLLAVDLFRPRDVFRNGVQTVIFQQLRRVALLAAHMVLAY